MKQRMLEIFVVGIIVIMIIGVVIKVRRFIDDRATCYVVNKHFSGYVGGEAVSISCVKP